MFASNHLLNLEVNSFINSTTVSCYWVFKIKRLIFRVAVGRVFL